MQPHELIAALVRDTKLPMLQVAIAISGRGFQSTLHKLVHGQIASPTRETAKKVADYFDLPVEALYDSKLATQIAFERGIKPLDPERDRPPRYGGFLQQMDNVLAGRTMEVREPTAEAGYRLELHPGGSDPLPAAMMAAIRRLSARQRKGLFRVIDAYLDAVDSSYLQSKATTA